ncbi:MAG: HU family DNA-binding protein [Rhodobacteraceae bacterium]|nr:HU family DNA-binding protein [Paracoccaceae bacterium]
MTSTSETTTETDIEDASEYEAPANLVKKKDIYDHVTVTTGLRRREVREAVDSTFAYIFDCLNAGYDVQCPPLGKIRVITKGEGDDLKLIYRLNMQKPGKGGKSDAEVSDDAAAAPE